MPLSFFLGVLLAYGRVYADSEMSVLHACGVSEWYVIRITLILGIYNCTRNGCFYPLSIANGGSEYEYQVKEKVAADSGLSSTLIAGRFQKTGNDKAVVFVHDKPRGTNELSKVFVAQIPDLEKGQGEVINASIVYAEKGLVTEDANGAQHLTMQNGSRYQSDANSQHFQKVEFGEYNIEIQEQKVEQKRRKLSAIATEDLWQDGSPESHAMIQWRLSFPLTCLILTLIAVPLSVVNPRQGKFAKMLPALYCYSWLISYYSLQCALPLKVKKYLRQLVCGQFISLPCYSA